MVSKDLYAIIFLLIWGAVVLYIYNLKFSKRSKATVEVVATVVGMNKHLSSGGAHHPSSIMVYQPTFQYDWKGFKRTLQVDIWSSSFNFEIGDKVTLLIDPDDPSNYRFKDPGRDPFSFIVFIFVIVIFVIVTAVLKR